MRAVKIFVLVVTAGIAACGDQGADSDSNAAARAAAPTEVEALPPDESAATPTDELANGAVEPPAGDNGLVAIKGTEPHD